MPKPFLELTIEEFTDLLGQFPFSRRIESVHVHHTWRPNHANFASRPPLDCIEGMFNFHTQVNGWSDIAQHATIDPRGVIWTGRDWNVPPASSTGFNGTKFAGPFMFEMIGDFDEGRDAFEGAQKAAAIAVVVALMKRFELAPEAVRFHNQTSPKTCPGTAIHRLNFLDDVRAAMAQPSAPRAFTAAESAMRGRSLSIVAQWTAGSRSAAVGGAGDEPREETMNAREVAVITGAETPAAAGRDLFESGADFTPEENQTLRPHVVDLRLGVFSNAGKFQTSLADVQRIFNELLPDELNHQQSLGQPLRLIFYAHGGLVSEEEGIRPILRRLPFWRLNGLYPIFFCWETGLKETLTDLLKGALTGRRDITDAFDELLESTVGPGGREVWGQMKRVAELASMTGGGARTVAELTSKFWAANHANMELHAVGHSAGAIFHSFFLPMLLDQKPGAGAPPITVKTLHFLAPACTTALFMSKLLPKIGPANPITAHTVYTMNKDLEKADTAGPYRKSLLYFVSRAFEDQKNTPILGLEESLRDDPALVRFYGLTRTIPGVGQILFSKTPDNAPLDSATESTRHGDFDNEVKTMNSVARRILNKPTGSIVSFVDETSRNEVSRALAFAPAVRASGFGGRAVPLAARALPGARAAARKAICIGIDAYPAPNALAGCVNDARDWGSALATLNFEVDLFLNQQATRLAILNAIDAAIAGAKPGDVIVIQYSGHGTQVKDLDGDETDGLDEALVPIDFGAGSFLIDDDLRGLMLKIPAGVTVTCFMDCCHSGTNTRLFAATPGTQVNGSRARFLKMTPELTEAHIAMRSQTRQVAVPPARTSDEMREINFAACRPDQVAFETNGSGDFTRRALGILGAGIDGVTNGVFCQRVIDAFGAAARQEPVLDCAQPSVTLPLFGLSAALAVATPPSRGDSSAALLDRLDAIERRLAKLGG